MPDTSNLLGIIAGILVAVGTVLYVLGILNPSEKKRIRPSRSTWFIWAVVAWIVLFFYDKSGAEETIWVPALYAVGATIIFLLSIKRGLGGWTKLDRWCLACAGLCLVVWVILGPVAALVASLAVDTAGFIPTLEKTWFKPETESRTAWTLGLIANFLNFLAIKEWGFAVATHPVYMFVAHIVIVVFLFRPHAKLQPTAKA